LNEKDGRVESRCRGVGNGGGKKQPFKQHKKTEKGRLGEEDNEAPQKKKKKNGLISLQKSGGAGLTKKGVHKESKKAYNSREPGIWG